MTAASRSTCNIARLGVRNGGEVQLLVGRRRLSSLSPARAFYYLLKLFLFAAGYLDRNLQSLLLGQDIRPRAPAGIAIPTKIDARPAVREGDLEAAAVATGFVIGDAYA